MERKSFLSAGSNVLFDPSFRAFFRACTGHDPFPWQERFAEACEKGTPPHVVNVPTGLGKTPGTIVGWVWSLAKAAEQPKTRQVPMRFIHVSPRRTIVDQTARLIDRIALVLKDPSTIQDQEAQEAAKWVADRLLSFTSNEGSPLLSARLRGGVQSNLSWRDRIDQPMAIASTSDLAGSGLLFRHWISSPSSWPVIAGLFGVDCVWVLDEAHLLEPLKSTILRCREAEERSPLRLPWWLISTTATPGETSGQMLGLSKQDCKNKTVRRRLEVKRKVTLREVEKNELEDRLVNLTLAAAKEKNAVLVVVDTVSQARKVFELISKKDRGAGGDGRILLLHGQQREHDRAQVLDKALTVFGMDTPPKENSDGLRDNGWYLIATNAIEVGVDLSADYLVTVACSGDSLLQRLGRLGRRADQVSYECYVVAVKNDDVKKRNNKLKKNKDSKNEEKETATLAEQYEQVVRDVVEKLKPGVTVTPLNPCGLNELISPRPHPVPLTSSDLRALVQTRPAPVDSPNVDALIHGLDDPYPTVFIAWRRDLDPEIESPENVWPWLLKSWPLRSHELLPVPIWELNGWLIEKRMTKTSFLLCEHGEQVRFVSEKTYVEIPVGSTIILPSVYGGHDGFGFNPTKTEPVEDIADLVVGDDVKVVGARLRLFNEDFEGAELKSLYDAFLKEVDDPDRDESYALGLLRSILEKLAEQENDARAKPAKFLRCLDDENLEWKLLDESTKLIGVTALRRNIDDDDELSLIRPVELEEHLADVASCAYNMAMRVGVQESFALVVGHAGLYHDIGKAEERFQASLYGGRQRRPDEPRLAKSGLPRRKWAQASRNAGVPRFFRHEALSEIIAMKRTNELVAHLAGAHHGWGRPWFPPIVSRFKPVIEVSVGSVSDNIHDNELQSKIPLDRARRFWWLNTVIGPWSLAWLEAALRLADHMVSGTPKIKSAKEINNQPVPDMSDDVLNQFVDPARRASAINRVSDTHYEIELPGIRVASVADWLALLGVLTIAHNYAFKQKREGVKLRWNMDGYFQPIPVMKSPVTVDDLPRVLLDEIRKLGCCFQKDAWRDLAITGKKALELCKGQSLALIGLEPGEVIDALFSEIVLTKEDKTDNIRLTKFLSGVTANVRISNVVQVLVNNVTEEDVRAILSGPRSYRRLEGGSLGLDRETVADGADAAGIPQSLPARDLFALVGMTWAPRVATKGKVIWPIWLEWLTPEDINVLITRPELWSLVKALDTNDQQSLGRAAELLKVWSVVRVYLSRTVKRTFHESSDYRVWEEAVPIELTALTLA